MSAKLTDEMFLLQVFYRGPWERLEGLACGIRRDGTLAFEIPAGATGWRRAAERLADYAEYRDRVWRAKYALRRRRPPARWARRAGVRYPPGHPRRQEAKQ